MKITTYYFIILSIFLTACSNPWDDRVDDLETSKSSVLVALQNNPDVSSFYDLILKTGYDKLLSTPSVYTVFAPNNEAVSKIGNNVLSDPKMLAFYVLNHIVVGSYNLKTSGIPIKLKMLSGKYYDFNQNDLIDNATIIRKNISANNGIVHVTSSVLVPALSIWEYISSTKDLSLASKAFVDANVRLSLSSLDSTSTRLSASVYDLKNEKNKYTVFIPDDASFQTHYNSLLPYFNFPPDPPVLNGESNVVLQHREVSFNIARDLIFPKQYALTDLPNELISRFGVKMSISKADIIGDPIQLSNGIVYRVKAVNILLKDKLVPTIIEGESASSSTNRDFVNIRTLSNFNDIMVRNSKISLFELKYNSNTFYSTKYQVFWRAVNNIQGAFSQRLVIGTGYFTDGKPDFNDATTPTIGTSFKVFPAQSVDANTLTEKLLGEVTFTNSGFQGMSLFGADSPTDGVNTMILDYIKFVPVLK